MKRFFTTIFIFGIGSNLLLAAGEENEIDSLTNVFNQNLKPTQKIKVLSRLITLHYHSNFNKAHEYASQLCILTKKHGEVQDKALAFWYLGKVYRFNQQFDLAVVNYLSAVKIYRKAGLELDAADVLNDIGYIFYKVREFRLAKHHYSEALILYKKHNSDKNVVRSNFNLGACSREEKDYDEALRYTHKALKLSKKIRDQILINKSFNYIGTIYFAKRDYRLARENYLNSVKTIDKEEDKPLRLSIGYNNIGEIYLEEGKTSKAREYFERSLIEIQELNDPEMTALILLNIGKLNLMEDQPDSAIVYLERSLSLIDFATATMNNNLKSAPSILIKAYECKKNPDREDYKRLLELNRIYIDHAQTTGTFNNKKLVNLVMANAEAKSDANNNLQKIQNIQNKSFWILFSAILAILGLLTLIYYREKRFKHFIKQMWNDIKDI